MRTNRVLFLLALLATMAAPAAARAATVTGYAASGERLGFSPATVVFTAAPGEVNRLTVAPAQGLTITDSGAVLEAQGTCRLVDPHTAVCPSSGFSFCGRRWRRFGHAQCGRPREPRSRK